MRRILFVVLLVASVVLAGCGGDDWRGKLMDGDTVGAIHDYVESQAE